MHLDSRKRFWRYKSPVFAVQLVLAIALTVHANQVEGPPPTPGGQPKATIATTGDGIVSLKFNTNQDWLNSGLVLKRGDRVRVRAWGTARIGQADRKLSDPDGLDFPNIEKLLPNARAFRLIAVVGDANNDYLEIGKESEFRASHDGVLYFRLNQIDPSSNAGDFDIRVTVGNTGSLQFGVGGVPITSPNERPDAPLDPANPNEKLVTVGPRLDWTNTYLQVKQGDMISVEATGIVNLRLGGDATGPEGIAKKDPGKLLADRPTGALIAVIGVDNNDFLFVGKAAEFKAQRSGLLFLGINEEDLTNNSGGFQARVRITRATK